MVKIIDHPLIKHKMTIMRNEATSTKDFRQNLDEIAGLMAYEITRSLALKEIQVKTPIAITTGYELEQKIILVPILRSGLGMVDGIKNVIPNVKIAHIGIFRDEETLMPKTYYSKFPAEVENHSIFIVDPMLATGGTAIEAINMVKAQGGKNIKLICLVGVQEGISKVEEVHPDIEIYLAAKDQKLLSNGYITPGLGDAGDRLFGTK